MSGGTPFENGVLDPIYIEPHIHPQLLLTLFENLGVKNTINTVTKRAEVFGLQSL